MRKEISYLIHCVRIHICLTINHASQDVVNAFLVDLKKAVDEVDALPDKGNDSNTVYC